MAKRRVRGREPYVVPRFSQQLYSITVMFCVEDGCVKDSVYWNDDEGIAVFVFRSGIERQQETYLGVDYEEDSSHRRDRQL